MIGEVNGRVEDVVVGPDGRRLVRFHGVFVGMANVREAQVVQEAVDRFRVLVVPDRGFCAEDSSEIVERLRQRVGDVKVSVIETDSIPRTASGKFQAAGFRDPTR